MITMFGIYTQSLKVAFDNKKVVFLVYAMNVIFGLMLALPFAATISSAIGNLGSMSDLMTGFDFTLFLDFLRIYGRSLGGLFSVAKWLVPIYIIFQIFLLGGIISVYKDGPGLAIGQFFSQCAAYFWRYVLVFLTFLVQHLIGSLLVIIPVSVILSDGLEGLSSEVVYWTTAWWSIGIYSIIFLFISAASDYAKIEMQDGQTGFWRCIGSGWKHVFKNFITTLGILIINVALVFLLLFVAWNISDFLGTDSVAMIFIAIVLQQVISMMRVFVRVVYYGSLVGVQK